MPKLADLEQISVAGSPFTFSAARINDLEASEYTLVGVCIDESGSVYGFKDELEQGIGNIVQACLFSPRGDNLLLRLTSFNTNIREIHGFKLLEQCNLGDYDNSIHPNGATALNDAAIDSIVAVSEYGKNLRATDFAANGIVVVLTDGEENASKCTTKTIADEIAKVRREEKVESLLTILIGINITDPTSSASLQRFKTEANFDDYKEFKDATPKTLAKVFDFISKSISSQAKSIRTGQSGAIPTI